MIIEILKILLAVPQAYFVFYSLLMIGAVFAVLIFKIRYKKSRLEKVYPLRFAIMVPAYRANKQLLNVLDACLNQKYPYDKFDVFVLAQHCPAGLVKSIRQKGITVFEKTFDDCEGNSYLHALNYFITAIEKHCGKNVYDAIVLVDKDNLLDRHFLEKINSRFAEGYRAVQGRRKPLNLDTRAACMDYVSETMNDMMFRAAKAGVGLSAEISGSGMAFDFKLYKEAITRVDFQSPVHDKTFYIELLKSGVHVFYEPEAVLFDEKTESYQGISHQRTRWMSGQFYLCRKYFFKLITLGIQQFRFDPIDYAFTLLKIPRAIHVLGLAFWLVLAVVFPDISMVSWQEWGFYLAGYFLSIIFFLIMDKAPKEVFLALLSSPLFALSLMKSIFKTITGKFQRGFIHTRHTKVVRMEDLQKNRM